MVRHSPCSSGWRTSTRTTHERWPRRRISDPPTDYPYGERQYNAEDIGGHRWTFSQSIADVDPAEWGGVLVTAAR